MRLPRLRRGHRRGVRGGDGGSSLAGRGRGRGRGEAAAEVGEGEAEARSQRRKHRVVGAGHVGDGGGLQGLWGMAAGRGARVPQPAAASFGGNRDVWACGLWGCGGLNVGRVSVVGWAGEVQNMASP